jgi:hypothetical protein
LGEGGIFLDSTNEECRKRLCLQIVDTYGTILWIRAQSQIVDTYGTTRALNSAIASDVA